MKILIIANWKCNPVTLQEAKRLFGRIVKGIKNACLESHRRVEVVICPPFVYLISLGTSTFAKSFGGLRLGSQNCFWEEKGAFTGEVSPKMLKDAEIEYVILGHSERRKNLNETNEMVNKKIKAVLRQGLKPILCIGSEKRGEAGKKEMAVQLKASLAGITKKDLEKIIITYEPIWAISTTKGGIVATPENTKEGKVFIREILTELFDRAVAEKIKIIYGGSVDSKNVHGFIKIAKMDGVLVGAASLRPDDFIAAVKKLI